jgi:kinesin family protein 5
MEGFTFDKVFDSDTRQEDIFDFGVKTIVEGELLGGIGRFSSLVDVMTGFNGTLFCYGQTGSGKTYSTYRGIVRCGKH